MVVLVANKMNSRESDFDWTPQDMSDKFGAKSKRGSDDGDYDWFTEGQNDFSDFDLPRKYNEPQAGQQLQTLFPSTDDFCSDVESDRDQTSRRKGGAIIPGGTASNVTKPENSTAIHGEDEITKIGDKDLRRKWRRDARARAMADAAWGESSVRRELDCRTATLSNTKGGEKVRSRGRSKTKVSSVTDKGKETKKPSKMSSVEPTSGPNAVLRRTVSVPLNGTQKPEERDRSSSRHGRTSRRPSLQNTHVPERDRSSSRHARMSLDDKSERDRSSSRHNRSCFEDTKPERELSTSRHGRTNSRRPSMRSVTPSERSKSPKNGVLDRIKNLEDSSHNVPDIVRKASQLGSCRSSSTRSLVAPDAETAKRRDRNRERRRSMSGSRRTGTKTGNSLLGADSTESTDDKCEDEMDLSSHRRQLGRPSKLEMVRGDSIRNMRATPSSSGALLQPIVKQNSNSRVLTLPDAPDLDDMDPKSDGPLEAPGRKGASPRSNEEPKKSRDMSRSRRDEAAANNTDTDGTRQRDRSRTRRWSVAGATNDDTAQISNSGPDLGRRGSSYLPTTLGSSRRGQESEPTSDNVRSASLKDVLSSAEKGTSSFSSASVPDRLYKKKSSSQACSVSLPGDVLKKKPDEMRSGSRRRASKDP